MQTVLDCPPDLIAKQIEHAYCPPWITFYTKGYIFYRFEDPDPERTAKSDHFNAKIRIFENVKKKSSEITSSYSFTLI